MIVSIDSKLNVKFLRKFLSKYYRLLLFQNFVALPSTVDSKNLRMSELEGESFTNVNKKFDSSPWVLNQEEDENSDNPKLTHDVFCPKSRALLNYISENLLAADLKWSLFCAACNSYRFDSVLKPFPPFFLNDDNKQIDRLREIVEMCPSMCNVIIQLRDNSLPSALQDLLHWVLIQLNEPNFTYIAKEEHEDIITQVSSERTATMPDYIFSVTYNKRSQQKFANYASNFSTRFAFHGSRLDNFYSITNYGLQVCMNKLAAFGPGIYLSKEMVVSLPYSPRGYTWNSSFFGSHISVLALCEVIDHPNVRSELDSGRNILDSLVNEPNNGKYLIVENSEMVCIKYLLIYSSEDFESASIMQSPTILGWIKRHKMFTFALGYLILLLGIGSSNSTLFYKFFKRLYRQYRNQEGQT